MVTEVFGRCCARADKGAEWDQEIYGNVLPGLEALLHLGNGLVLRADRMLNSIRHGDKLIESNEDYPFLGHLKSCGNLKQLSMGLFNTKTKITPGL